MPNFSDVDSTGNTYSVIVLDKSDKVIYSSPNLNIKALTVFSQKDMTLAYSSNLPAIQIGEREYLYKEVTTDNGWVVKVLSKPNTLITAYKYNFYKLIFSLFIISVLALAVTRRFAKQSARPLERLVRYFEAQKPVPNRSMKYLSSEEVESIRTQLIDAQSLMIDIKKS
ncbi:hypothetical protein GCM10009123_11310 [Kangiella japonica]|uniref:Uncharacterized protein n=1 Tax=Kangiella japonica TaxID=647384 RepID=A0ABP3CHP8_9GAMM